MILAQAETIGRLVDETSKTAKAEYGLIGILLVLVIAGIGVGLWLFGKFLARRDDLERTSREKTELQFITALKEQRELDEKQNKEQRELFERQMAEQRKQGLELGKSGQLSVTVLAEAFHELNLLLCSESGINGITESAIHRRKEARRKNSESVLE